MFIGELGLSPKDNIFSSRSQKGQEDFETIVSNPKNPDLEYEICLSMQTNALQSLSLIGIDAEGGRVPLMRVTHSKSTGTRIEVNFIRSKGDLCRSKDALYSSFYIDGQLVVPQTNMPGYPEDEISHKQLGYPTGDMLPDAINETALITAFVNNIKKRDFTVPRFKDFAVKPNPAPQTT